MSLADYLAKNYLTADPPADKKLKKRKRKGAAAQATDGLIIADDDAMGWENNRMQNDDDDDPLTVNASSAEFRKSKKNNWTTVGTSAPTNSEQAAADAILASAAAERKAQQTSVDDEDGPTIATTGASDANNYVNEEDDANITKMESGAHAGLQSAEQVTAALRKRQAEELRRFREEQGGDPTSGMGQETIYRDASGRIINVAMKRAEARRKAEEEAAKKQAELEAQKGDVQRVQRDQKRQQLQDAKYMTVARYADDVDLNAELKDRERWNDPAAQFLSSKKKGKSVTGKPLYQGAAPPNRYGIRPGHRWDGVDRSNGFEKEYFAAQNRRKNIRDLEYAWQMDE
ncbi:hypothetical protein L228DRAFT_240099 [Xylona heveae TC161]|uniref:Pre-mRNA-splicing factor CWC26 n=1 Tax=Xylona heveae (strain CBS 132557 / TC161) TaxID=1328760 RepID=A0A165FPK2_XYLHT|nr:hypothetical protein L228DRAFT_240099 [Xylona heveae TC161]KZF21229.1 hypothetical protein L228DRAFT_240099 [Xylona heveae TC161]